MEPVIRSRRAGTFLDKLEALGIPTGPYNLPDWDDTPEGLNQRLDSLFPHSPPTALIVAEAPLLHAADGIWTVSAC